MTKDRFGPVGWQEEPVGERNLRDRHILESLVPRGQTILLNQQDERTADIADGVKEISEKAVDFRPRPQLGVRARTKMACRHTPQHVIFFNPKERSHLSHILAHECARILRMFRIPAEDRQVPASAPESLRAASDEIRGEARHLPADLRDEAVDMWIHGLITQVTSQPIDVRIEEWISDSYPGLRDEQRRSLRTEMRTTQRASLPA